MVAVRDPQQKQALGEVGGQAQFPHISTAPVVLIWLLGVSRIRDAVHWHQAEEPAGIKPRIPQEAFLHWGTYDAEAAVDVAAYDDTLAAYCSRCGKFSLRRR